ncbi:MAG: alpha/beta hydrolase [Thaumarchaeota archaeon]|nr:alpha/beta hydrolase [Nitrososphaerota archaeon]
MTEFVLIPGAWLGAWAWKEVASHLEKKGHSAYPVTLTGMGDRVHLVSKDVGLETAVQDALNVVKYNELGEFVLVGHSFAGKVAAVLADREHGKVKKVIYLDAFRPDRTSEPQGGFDPTREFGAQPPGALGVPLTEEIVERIAPDVKGRARARMMSLATPWPIKMSKDPFTLSGSYGWDKEAYVFCTQSGDLVDEIVAGKWGALNGPHRIIEAGHWPMITKPEETAEALLALAK